MVRIPTVESEAWREYGLDWDQLDAPRHLVLHSRKSAELAAIAAGVTVVDLWDDSTGFQFWGSEIYKKGRTLFEGDERPAVLRIELFARKELASFERRAKRLNKKGRRDQLVIEMQRALAT